MTPAPPTDGRDTTLILMAHGSRRHPAANAHLRQMADAVAARGIFADVRLGCVQGEPSLDDALANIETGRILALPLVMSDGKLVDDMLARVWAALSPTKDVAATAPLGTDERIPEIAAGRARAALDAAGIDAGAAHVVLVSHGSPDDGRNRLNAKRHAGRISASALFAGVRVAFIEEPPSIVDAIAGIPGPAAVVGLFTAPGGHAIDDVGQALAATERRDVVDAGPIGLDARLPELIADLAVNGLKTAGER